IAMDDALPMSVVQGPTHRRGDAKRFCYWELLLTIDARAQALALDEGHYVKQQSARFAAVEQRQQIGMLEIRRHPDLGEKTLHAKHGAELGLEHLQRDMTIMSRVAGQVHRCH